jgi:hypothetical protein
MSFRQSLRAAVVGVVAGVIAAAGFSCSGSRGPAPRGAAFETKPRGRRPAVPPSAAGPAHAAPHPDAGPALGPGDLPVSAFEVAIRDPEILAALEAKGFSLGGLVFDEKARTTAELDRLPGMKSLFDVLRQDVRSVKRTHPLAKVTSSDGFRLFDERWFASDEMRFELIGAFNRFDRQPFNAGTCGEIRFVYRLVYETKHAGSPMAGRLPMTMNVVFLVLPYVSPQPGRRKAPDCGGAALDWGRIPKNQSATATAEWFATRGPFGPGRRALWNLKSIETNLQSFRLQSFVHPTMGGHIDYVLRVFQAQGKDTERRRRDRFEPAPMENMPDVAAIEKDPKLRAELLAYLRAGGWRENIDRGTLRLPERFLAKRAVSVSPRGLTRPGNRPFRTLFEEADFADLELTASSTIKTPAALLRRLDGMTCTGCHQSRSMAGFHHLGNDSVEHPAFDALLSGSSSHLESDLDRRRIYLAQVAARETPDEFRPIPERQGVGTGFGAPCGLGDAGFADWTCANGFRCTKLEDAEVGTCLPAASVGSPCQFGEVSAKAQPHHDQIVNMKDQACGETQRCDNNRSGFPLGACAAACNSSAFGSTCADFLDADAFQNCLRSRQTFEACAKEHVFGAGLRACDVDDPCRQDYVCVRSRTPGVGACVPPYFVYQLRLDGYPLLR